MDERQNYFDEQGITGSDTPEGKKKLSRKARLIIGIGASVIILALGLSSAFLIPTQKPEELVLTVFSNDWSEITLKPGVETALNEYLASDSSVPGFPLRVACSGADDIQLEVDAGTLFTWGPPDYVADSKGSSYAVQSDDTAYWSPFGADNKLVSQCTLTVTARKDDKNVSQKRLILRQAGETGYSITLLASE